MSKILGVCRFLGEQFREESGLLSVTNQLAKAMGFGVMTHQLIFEQGVYFQQTPQIGSRCYRLELGSGRARPKLTIR